MKNKLSIVGICVSLVGIGVSIGIMISNKAHGGR